MVSASVRVYAADGKSFKRCASFESEVTYNLTKVTVTCPQKPVAWQHKVVVQVVCAGSVSVLGVAYDREVCEVRVFGRRFEQGESECREERERERGRERERVCVCVCVRARA